MKLHPTDELRDRASDDGQRCIAQAHQIFKLWPSAAGVPYFTASGATIARWYIGVA